MFNFPVMTEKTMLFLVLAQDFDRRSFVVMKPKQTSRGYSPTAHYRAAVDRVKSPSCGGVLDPEFFGLLILTL